MTDEPTLAHVFSKPPPYTRDELALVIKEYREKRHQYITEGKSAKAKKPKGAAINLDALDLEL